MKRTGPQALSRVRNQTQREAADVTESVKLPRQSDVNAGETGDQSKSRMKFDDRLLVADAADRLLRLSGLKLLSQQFSCVVGRKCANARRHWIITAVGVLLPFVGYLIASVKDYRSGQILSP